MYPKINWGRIAVYVAAAFFAASYIGVIVFIQGGY